MKKIFNSKISKASMCCLLTALFVSFQTNLYADETWNIGKSYPDNVVATFDPATGNLTIERGPVWFEDLLFEGWRDQSVVLTDNGDGSFTIETTGNDPYVFLEWLELIDLRGEETSIKITFEYKSNQSVDDAAVFLFDYESTHVGTVEGLSLPAASDWTYGEFDLTSKIQELNADYYAGIGDYPVWGYAGDFMRIDPTINSDTYEITIRNLKLEIEDAEYDGIMDDFTYATQPWAAVRDAIREVTIKPGVSSIGASVFEGTGITKADIPLTATSIAANAFKGCNSLIDIKVHYVNLTGITVDNGAFADIANLAAIKLTVPTCKEDVYQYTAPWKDMTIESDCGETAIAKIPVESFTINPNPTNGIVNIDNAKGEVVEIYTISGTLLFKTNASVIDLKNYSSGVYLIKMGDKVGKVIKK
jgi:hypothetical protein